MAHTHQTLVSRRGFLGGLGLVVTGVSVGARLHGLPSPIAADAADASVSPATPHRRSLVGVL